MIKMNEWMDGRMDGSTDQWEMRDEWMMPHTLLAHCRDPESLAVGGGGDDDDEHDISQTKEMISFSAKQNETN